MAAILGKLRDVNWSKVTPESEERELKCHEMEKQGSVLSRDVSLGIANIA